ncbi:XapX domain-containing protein [Chitinimonas naiadis]
MISLLIGAVLGTAVGALCRWLDIPSPAPPSPIGALLVVAMSAGFVLAGHIAL